MTTAVRGVLARLFLGALFTPMTHAVQPVLISSYATGTDNTYLWKTGGPLTAPAFIVNLRQATSGGVNNCGVLVASANSGLTFGTPTDNKSNTWTSFASLTAGGVTLRGWYSLGIASGTTQVTVNTSGVANGGSGSSSIGGWFQEFSNCGTSIGGTGSTSFTADGAVHTLTLSAAPTSGDAVLGYFIDTSTPQTFPIEGSAITVGANFTALSSQITFGKLSEINTATTSTSVGATYPNSSDTILGVGVVVKQGSTGTGPPTGMYIDHYQTEQIPSTGPQALTFPFGGNLIVGMLSTGSANTPVTSITDAACTWSTGTSNTNGYTSQIFYGANCTPSSTNSLTVSWSGTMNSPGSAIALASVTNASTSPFDRSANTSGNHTTATNFTSLSLTPSALNEMTFSVSSISWHTLTAMVTDGNGHTPTILSSTNSKDDDADPSCSTATPPSTLDEDNGWAYYINSTNARAVTFIFSGTQTSGTCTNNPAGVGGWNAVAVAFKAASSGVPAPPTNLVATPH